MRTIKQSAFVIVLLTLSVPSIASSGSTQPKKKALSNTCQMRCVVKVTADAEVVPLSFELVESLIRSDAVEGKATRVAWPPGHRTPDSCLNIQPLEDFAPADDASPSQARTLLFELHVRLDTTDPAGPCG